MARSIYIVDDDAGVRVSLLSLLSARGDAAVHSFASGDKFLQDAPMLDNGVVLLDFNMPGLDGVAVLKAIQTLPGKNFSTVILSGEGNVELAVRAMKAGALDFVEKPFDSETLTSVLDHAFSSLDHDDREAASAKEARAKIDLLSPRERDVLIGLIEGGANKVIAIKHDISPRTVEIYRANLMKKLSVRSLSEALRVAFAAGLITA